VNDWIHTILDACLRELVALNRPSKYLLSCVLSQKNGAGFRSVASQYWDGRSDFTCAVPWENDHIHCLVTVHAVALHLTGHTSSGTGAGATGMGAVVSQAQDKAGTDQSHKKKQEAEVIVQTAADGGGERE
jgi:dynein light chain Tctex-type 1